MPPESWSGNLFINSPRPTLINKSSASFCSSAPFFSPRIFGPKVTFSIVVCHGIRAVSWKTTILSFAGPVIGVPSTSTCPVSGFSNPASKLTSVDFPQPEGPTITVNSPAGKSTETSLRTSSDCHSSP